VGSTKLLCCSGNSVIMQRKIEVLVQLVQCEVESSHDYLVRRNQDHAQDRDIFLGCGEEHGTLAET